MPTLKKLREAGDFGAINRRIPYSSFVSLESGEDDKGLLTILRPRESNMGNTLIRAVHGGVVGALIEHAGVMQVMKDTAPEHLPKIINLTVEYLRPCLVDEEAFARGIMVKLGRRIANVRVEVWQSDPERPVAVGHAHFLVE
ncbi:MAG: PaaI family thioesterase [Rhodospirillales bacterium]|nr:PaaI family thioesterase [Rhodospirillales bacterium]MCW8861781.1 PaaI family thioesterase [Rhodospirillales bacterium]MCW8951537.1 PaaI family thioesterase [Rhodospirillales bacterium]MCW8969791.1 PaaI family thioesterase [Rhodospirillales bacterium]MCW9001711.1 PaaI family thioesterase [Rhodospirillales bacterium]